MKEVWIVSFVDYHDRAVFSTAEKAYNCIVEELNYNSMFSDKVRQELLDELAADYIESPDNFGVTDFGWVEKIEVDTW